MRTTEADLFEIATYYFGISNNSITGYGGEILLREIDAAQFFMIGEEHDMAELQNLTNTLIPLMKTKGYHAFAAEIGVSAAKKLESTIRDKNSLKALNNRYSSLIGRGPFGFFDTVEEEETLRYLRDNDLQLWGIDFESFDSSLFFIDELFELSSKGAKIQKQFDVASKFILTQYEAHNNNKSYPLCKELLNSEEIKSFFNLLPRTRVFRRLIKNQVRSWKLHEQQRRGNWFPRVRNMNENFIRNYNFEAKNGKSPKIFIKLGGVHTANGVSSSGFQEVGDLIYKLANKNETNVFSVLSFARFCLNDCGEIIDQIESGDEAILSCTKKDSWSLIDLRKVDRDAAESRIRLSEKIRRYIKSYDVLLIPPVTRKMIKNYGD